MPKFVFTLEQAKSGRASCKGCTNTIQKGSLRIGIKAEVAEGAEVDDRARHMIEALKWYHFDVDCVRKFRKTAAWWKQNTPERAEVLGLDEIEDEEDLEDRLDKLLEELKSLVDEKKSPAAAKGKKRAKKADDEEDDQTVAESEDKENKRKRSKPAGGSRKKAVKNDDDDDD